MTIPINAKYVVFSGIAVMTAYVLWHNERFLIEPENPIWQHYAKIKWLLLPHALFGAIVILLAPLQFSERLRKRYVKLHRIAGRLYVIGVLLISPLGAYLQYDEERMGQPRTFTILAVTNAVMLMGATALAFLFAYQRKIAQHRQWMTRSYAIALVFIVNRFILGITGWELLGVEMVQAIIWACLAMAVLLGDVAIAWKDVGNLFVSRAETPASKQQNLPQTLEAD
jgi:disulfide bond formation protein DsbB